MLYFCYPSQYQPKRNGTRIVALRRAQCPVIPNSTSIARMDGLNREKR